MRTQGYFIPHCDFEYCDLGAFTYICPRCRRSMDDYEIWWKEDEIWKGQPFNFTCPSCQTDLMVSHDCEEYGYFVEEFGNINTPLID